MNPALLTLALVAAAPATKDTKKDVPSIVGEWAIESAHRGDKADPPPPDTTWTFTGDGKSVLVIGGGRGTTESKYTIDLKQTPPWVDVAEGPKGMPLKGIYKADGDTLTLCFAEKVGERPMGFESPAASKAVVLVLKRVKKKE
jgi:uncharacterized protein (TIGR03067 family)